MSCMFNNAICFADFPVDLRGLLRGVLERSSSSPGDESPGVALPGHLLQVCFLHGWLLIHQNCLNRFRYFRPAIIALILHVQALLGGAADEQSSSELMSAIRSLTGQKIRVSVSQ